jgi:hypothetical protein
MFWCALLALEQLSKRFLANESSAFRSHFRKNYVQMLQAIVVLNVVPNGHPAATVNLHTSTTSSLPTSSDDPSPATVALIPPRPSAAYVSTTLLTPTLTMPPDAARPTAGMQSCSSAVCASATRYSPLQPFALFSVSLADSQGSTVVNTAGLKLQPAIVDGDGVLTRLGGPCPDAAVQAVTGHGLCSAWIPQDRFPETGASIIYVTIEAQVCRFAFYTMFFRSVLYNGSNRHTNAMHLFNPQIPLWTA